MAVLLTGFFGVIGANVAHAQGPDDLFKKADEVKATEDGAAKPTNSNSSGNLRTELFKEKNVNTVGTSKSLPFDSVSTDDDIVQDDIVQDRAGCKILRLDRCVISVFAIIGNAMLNIFALFTGIAGYILDRAVDYTIVGMGKHTRDIGAIETGWKVFRDLSNIVIIFVLLVIGIATILQPYQGLENYGAKALLAKLIVVALLINFSLFFTQVIIDSSNLISLQFYNKITEKSVVVGGEDIVIIETVGEKYMQAFGLTTLYDGKEIFKPERLSGKNTFLEIFLTSVLGSVVFLVSAFAFLAGAFLLISRFVVLIFLMILAPLAFVGMILPSLSKHASKWWGALMRYAFFAPAYMILTWFVIEVINSDSFGLSIGLNETSSFASAITGGNMAIIFNFIIVIAFIIASVLISNYFGIIGSNAVIKWGHAARKFGQGVVGRSTIGLGSKYGGKAYDRGAAKFAGSNLGKILRKIPGLKQLGAIGDLTARNVISAGEGAKFGSGASYADMDKKYEARRKEIAEVQENLKEKDAIDVMSDEAKFEKMSPKEQREFAAIVGKMSIKELEKRGIRENLAYPEIAKNLSTDMYSALDKSEVFTKQQVEAIKDARFEDIMTLLNSKDPIKQEKGKKMLRALGDKEMEIFGSRLYEAGMIEMISQSQVEGIKKSAKINSSLKKRVLDTKEMYFKALVRMEDGSLEKELDGMKIPQIAKLDPDVLTSKEGINFVSRNVLAEIIKESTAEDKKKVIDGVVKAYDEATAPGSSTKISKDLEDAYEALTDKTLPMALFT